MQIAQLIEKDQILVGCTANEDKLQGVPSCIETLSRAGIKKLLLFVFTVVIVLNTFCVVLNSGLFSVF